MARFAGPAARLAVEDTVAERDLCRGRARRDRQGARLLRARARVNAFGRLHLPSDRAGGCIGRPGRRGRCKPRRLGVAVEADPPDAPVLVVRDVEGAVGSKRESPAGR
jgi:hypothetical protein